MLLLTNQDLMIVKQKLVKHLIKGKPHFHGVREFTGSFYLRFGNIAQHLTPKELEVDFSPLAN
jgi:hypothetical protein